MLTTLSNTLMFVASTSCLAINHWPGALPAHAIRPCQVLELNDACSVLTIVQVALHCLQHLHALLHLFHWHSCCLAGLCLEQL